MAKDPIVNFRKFIAQFVVYKTVLSLSSLVMPLGPCFGLVAEFPSSVGNCASLCYTDGHIISIERDITYLAKVISPCNL